MVSERAWSVARAWFELLSNLSRISASAWPMKKMQEAAASNCGARPPFLTSSSQTHRHLTDIPLMVKAARGEAVPRAPCW